SRVLGIRKLDGIAGGEVGDRQVAPVLPGGNGDLIDGQARQGTGHGDHAARSAGDGEDVWNVRPPAGGAVIPEGRVGTVRGRQAVAVTDTEIQREGVGASAA